ncbi:DUF4765 family protein [Escherichia coli]|uniref:DUF4765 family protein n=1 Tax=Escherichia coli TaxID=562 RepID=UPI0024C4B12B|nr:DUF4765 family protein [Escherichia coli]
MLFYGRESFDIVLDAMNVYRKSKKMRVISNNEMKKSIKISELVIHNIIKERID